MTDTRALVAAIALIALGTCGWTSTGWPTLAAAQLHGVRHRGGML